MTQPRRMLDLRNSDHFALVDDEDFARVSGYGWYVTANGYVGAMTTVAGKRTMILLHRLLTDAPPKSHVDHKNGDKLDNRRTVNLRVVTCQVNQANRKRLNRNNHSGARGVGYIAHLGKWRAQIMSNRKCIHVGLFTTRQDAIAARKQAELIHFGELCPDF